MLDKQAKKTLFLSSLGGTLEFYDFIIFLFFTSVISVHFFPDSLSSFWKTLNTYVIFAAAYFARPLGGIVMAHFGDKNGRKKMFMLSILLMVIPTFVLGIMPTFETFGYGSVVLLLVIRLLQGIAIGGELPGAWVFVSEHVSHKHQGLAIGFLTASVAGGIFLGCLVSILTRLIFENEVTQWAWRIPFVLGGIFGLCSIYLRRFLDETPVFKEIQKNKQIHTFPLKKVLKDNKISILISMLFTWILTAAVVVVVLILPKLVGEMMTLTELEIVFLQMLVVFGMCLGCVFAGVLVDKIGIFKACVIFCVFLCFFSSSLLMLVFRDLHLNIAFICLVYFFCSLFTGIAIFSPLYSLRLFPSEICFSGLSFSYNVAYAIFGGLAPIFVSWAFLSKNMSYVMYYLDFLSLLGLIACVLIYKFKLLRS